MKIIALSVGPLETNCYILAAETGECFLIDPGADAAVIAGRLDREKLRPRAILLTHGHFDHIGAADTLRTRFGVEIYLHGADWEMAQDAEKNFSTAVFPRGLTLRPDQTLADGETLTLGELQVRVIETPGHSMGGVSFYLEKENLLFSGDTLFAGGYGRTDLYGGDQEELAASVRKLLLLPGGCRVLPGHGGETTVERERGF